MNISVIIPVFNAERFINKAVESAISHIEVKEVLLIEDGSNDNSFQICKALAAKNNRIFLYHHKNRKNKGAGASRNLGLLKATQKYVCFLDADDFMAENRFEKEKKIFSEYRDCDGVYGAIGVCYIDKTGAKAWEKKGNTIKSLTTVNKQIKPEHLFEFLISFNNPNEYKGYFSIDALTLKRESLLKNKIFFDESLRLHQDTVFIFQCAYYLNLYTGEYQIPIAFRGIHKNNRFIFHTNLKDSRSKQFKSLIKWSKNEGLKKEYKNFFIKQYRNINPKSSIIKKSYNKIKLGLTYIRNLIITNNSVKIW